MRRIALLTALLVAVPAPAASGAWRQLVGGPSPINRSPERPAFGPGMVVRDGVPYVAWQEFDGANYEIRVAALDRDAGAWIELPDARSPINRNPNRDGVDPSLALVDGALYVAWSEYDSSHWQVRVARLDDATGTWSEVGEALNHSPAGDGHEPSLAAVEDVPFVAWTESDGANEEVRVASLRETGWREVVGGDSPVNHSHDRDASYVSLAASGDEAYLAWQEWNGRNYELYVSEWEPGNDEWEPVGDGPLNRAVDRSATRASLLEIGGVWHVAWSETDGRNFELRVARLNAAGDAWDELVGGDSPINQSPTADAFRPNLAEIDGRPYVAWTESTGTYDDPAHRTSYAVHVARLNTPGTAWEHVVRGDGPINASPTGIGSEPSLAAVAGVPYIAWREFDGRNSEIRVARLEPELLDASELVSADGALLLQRVRTYGVPYPIGLSVDGGEPVVRRTAADSFEDVVTAQVGGLSPGTHHTWRAFGWDGVSAIGAGEPRSFTTASAALSFPPSPAAGSPVQGGRSAAPRLVLVATRAKFKGRARHAVRLRYVLDRRAAVTVSLYRNGRRVARLRDAGHAGRNVVVWRGRRVRAGRYAVVFSARDPRGVTARDTAKLTVR